MKWRFKLFVFPKFQIPLVMSQWLFQTIAFGFVGFLVSQHFSEMENHAFSAGLTTAHPYFPYLEAEKYRLFTKMCGAWIVGSIATWISGAVYTSKLAGPMIRTLNYLKDWSKNHGNMAPLKFRKNDFLSEFPSIINEALQADRDGSLSKKQNTKQPLKKTGS